MNETNTNTSAVYRELTTALKKLERVDRRVRKHWELANLGGVDMSHVVRSHISPWNFDRLPGCMTSINKFVEMVDEVEKAGAMPYDIRTYQTDVFVRRKYWARAFLQTEGIFKDLKNKPNFVGKFARLAEVKKEMVLRKQKLLRFLEQTNALGFVPIWNIGIALHVVQKNLPLSMIPSEMALIEA